MRYEAKHSYFKRLLQNLGNFINIPWTLGSRHQKWQCYQWIGDEPLGQVEPEIGPGKRMLLCNLLNYISVNLNVYRLCIFY